MSRETGKNGKNLDSYNFVEVAGAESRLKPSF
jgi:hypothetical protein